MRLEVYPSPMHVAWHWRLRDGNRTLACSPLAGFETYHAMLRDIDRVAEVFAGKRPVDLIKLEEAPNGSGT